MQIKGGRAYPYGSEYSLHAYLQQLARAKRFLDRYRAGLRLKPTEPGGDYYSVDDQLWAFIQNCWHVKDWLKNDFTLDADLRVRAGESIHAEERLLIIADLANGTKHFLHEGRHTGAQDSAIQLTDLPGGGEAFVPVIELKDRRRLLVTDVSVNGMIAWREILSAHGLDHFAPPD